MSRLTAKLPATLLALVAVAPLAVAGVTVLADSVYLPVAMRGVPTATPSPSAAPASPTPSNTSTLTPTATQTTAPSSTPSPTATPSITPSPTNTATWTSSPTATATHTPTKTPTPTPTQCNTKVQVLENPGFESGWPPWKTMRGVVFRFDVCAFHGTYGLGFGGDDHEEEIVMQRQVVPEWATTGAAYFSWRMFSDDSPSVAYDAFGLQVRDTFRDPEQGPVAISVVFNNDSRGTWYTRRVVIPDVHELRGHLLEVALVALTDYSFPTWWCTDDVQLVFACGSQVP